MAVAKPSKLPIWDINATNIVEPQSTNQSDGWQVDANGIPQKPPFQYHNYMWHTQYKWFEYLDAEKALLQGDNTKTFKVADATLADEALSKGQLLIEMKAVDGIGSGLDADLLDGLNSSSFLRRDIASTIVAPVGINNGGATEGGQIDFASSIDSGNSSCFLDIIGVSASSFRMIQRDINDGLTVLTFPVVTGTVWTSGNDGVGSGLDADLLRGFTLHGDSIPNTVVARKTDASIDALNTPTAWVVFDGRNGAMYSSYGIGYITRNSLGFYNIVFSTPMATLNYALVGSGGGIVPSVDISVRAIQEVTNTPRRLDLVQITTRATNSGGNALEDWTYVSLVFFGGN